MAGSGSENRRRQVTLKARFSEVEAALIKEQADRAGVSVAAVIRYLTLGQTPLRASRQPTINRREVSRLIGVIGSLKAALKEAADKGTPGACDQAVEAVCRDFVEVRNELFEALGKEP